MGRGTTGGYLCGARAAGGRSYLGFTAAGGGAGSLWTSRWLATLRPDATETMQPVNTLGTRKMLQRRGRHDAAKAVSATPSPPWASCPSTKSPRSTGSLPRRPWWATLCPAGRERAWTSSRGSTSTRPSCRNQRHEGCWGWCLAVRIVRCHVLRLAAQQHMTILAGGPVGCLRADLP